MNSVRAAFERPDVRSLISASVKVSLRGQILWTDGASGMLMEDVLVMIEICGLCYLCESDLMDIGPIERL